MTINSSLVVITMAACNHINYTKYDEPGQNINAQVSISIYYLCREFHSKNEVLRLIWANKFESWELIIDGLRLNLGVRIS